MLRFMVAAAERTRLLANALSVIGLSLQVGGTTSANTWRPRFRRPKALPRLESAEHPGLLRLVALA
jgi:hypothetical protein